MLFLKHQILDMEDVVCTVIPASPLRREDFTKAVSLINANTRRRYESDPARVLIVFHSGQSQAVVGISNSEIKTKPKSHSLVQSQRWIYLESAVKTRFEGLLEQAFDGVAALERYLEEQGLRAITSVYGVFLSGVGEDEENREVILDLYIGIDKNVVLNILA